jgi:hypothetical protein
MKRWSAIGLITSHRAFVGSELQGRQAMSALGQKLPRRGQVGMSALPPKAAATVADQRVRFGPTTDIGDLIQHSFTLSGDHASPIVSRTAFASGPSRWASPNTMS